MIKMGVSGEEGSFSEEAALQYAKQKNMNYSLRYLIDMEGVLKAIGLQEIDIGIFPVVNLQGGLVKQAFEAMGKYLFVPFDELWLQVRQCMLVVPGTKKEQIKRIVSHSQGLAQCRHYLQVNFGDIPLQEWCDTAKAAKDLAGGIFDPNTAVIAPERSAMLYGLDIFAKDIHDNKSNLTAFILVKNRVNVLSE